MSESALLGSVRDYYAGRLAEHGPTARGVDWNSAESQALRFDQLLEVADLSAPCRIGDYGCGYGALYDHLLSRGIDREYLGYDLAPSMVEAARLRHAGESGASYSADEGFLDGCDFIVASGVFNVKLSTPADEWEAYVTRTIGRLAALSRRGFAFNCLTSYSDSERMRPDLHYADPCALFDHCKRNYSRDVALAHDYGLYEFTIVVRKSEGLR